MLLRNITLLSKLSTKFILPAILLILISSQDIYAQTATSLDIEEIVVTSTKKNTTLQETPVSVSVIQMEDIERLAISDILDLQSSVPSLQINQTKSFNPYNKNFF